MSEVTWSSRNERLGRLARRVVERHKREDERQERKHVSDPESSDDRRNSSSIASRPLVRRILLATATWERSPRAVMAQGRFAHCKGEKYLLQAALKSSFPIAAMSGRTDHGSRMATVSFSLSIARQPSTRKCASQTHSWRRCHCPFRARPRQDVSTGYRDPRLRLSVTAGPGKRATDAMNSGKKTALLLLIGTMQAKNKHQRSSRNVLPLPLRRTFQ